MVVVVSVAIQKKKQWPHNLYCIVTQWNNNIFIQDTWDMKQLISVILVLISGCIKTIKLDFVSDVTVKYQFNKCSDRNMEVKLSSILVNYDRQTNQPTHWPINQPTIKRHGRTDWVIFWLPIRNFVGLCAFYIVRSESS